MKLLEGNILQEKIIQIVSKILKIFVKYKHLDSLS